MENFDTDHRSDSTRMLSWETRRLRQGKIQFSASTREAFDEQTKRSLPHDYQKFPTPIVVKHVTAIICRPSHGTSCDAESTT